MKTTTLSLLLIAAAGSLAYAQSAPAPELAPASSPTAEQAAPTEALAAALAPLKVDPQLHRGQLENGLTYLIRPTKEPAGRASVRLFVNTGSLNESPETSGISHFIEHMVFNGSRNFKRGELIPAMQNLGLGFGGDANAYTSLLETVYMLDLPNLKPETVDFAMTILRDFADGAELADEAIDIERGIIVSELKSRDSASYRAGIEQLRHLVGGSRVPDYLPIGSEEVIKNCPAETIRKYYRDNYVPARMTVIVTGDVSVADAEAWVKKHFESMQAGPNPPRPAIGTPTNTLRECATIPNDEAATTKLSADIVSPWVKKEDSLEKRITDMPLDLACAMLNKRLSRMARKEDCPFMGAAVGKQEIYQSAEVFSFTVNAQPDKWEPALRAAQEELRRACLYGFSAAELREAAAEIEANCRKACDSWETVTASSVAQALVNSLSDDTVFTPPVEDARAYALGLAFVQSQPDLCREALGKAFDSARAKISITGRIPQDVNAELVEAYFEETMQKEIAPPAAEKELKFAYDNVGEPGKVVNRNVIDDMGITTLTLENGVRVNLKSLDFMKGSVSVSAAVDGGYLKMPATPALEQVLSTVMSQGALEAHTLEELGRIMAGHDVGMNFGMQDERFVFAGETNERELELQCKLLCAAIMHPGYHPDGELQLRRSLPTIYHMMETTPEGAFSKQGDKLMFGDDPRFTFPTAEQFEAVGIKEVKAVMAPFLKDGAMEVTLVGDFDVEKAIPVIERTFGAMPKRSPEFTPVPDEARKVSFRPWGQREFLRYDTELDKTIVAQVLPAGDGRDMHRNRRLSVLTAIVREKLFDVIRAELGESYSPSVRLETRSGYADAATLMAASSGVKRNREKVTAAMDIVFASLARGEITDKDFQQAIRPYIARAQKSLRTASYWAGGMSRLQSDAKQLDLMRDTVTDAKAITLEEIQALAKEIFGGENKANYFFTVPNEAEKAPAAEEPAPAAEEEPTPALVKGAKAPRKMGKKAGKKASGKKSATAKGEYAILTSKATQAVAGWDKVVDALKKRHPEAQVEVLDTLTEESCAAALRKVGARYAAVVLRPEECGLEIVNTLHRAARKVDDDIWGDCIWGIVTGATPEAAVKVVSGDPLVIKRLLGTTNVGAGAFEHSCCITDWTGSPVMEQSGYKEPKQREIPAEQTAREDIFDEQLSTQKPQLIVTSSHATQFNLEMPFGKGLIFPAHGKFHRITQFQMGDFRNCLWAAMRGKPEVLNQLADKLKAPAIEPDGEPRVWLAAGNCLFGNAQHTAQSMVVTAMSAYNCKQVVGYTVPSWYGKGGWGTLSMFFENIQGGSLAEAWYLNNQFILNETLQLHPELLKAQFNDAEIGARFIRPMGMTLQRLQIPQPKAEDALGLVHDRDVVALYGDPAWRACIDGSHSSRPLSIEWQGDKQFTITAHGDHKGRAAVWFPTAATGEGATGCDAEGAVFTNDFILFPTLEMKKGERKTVTIQ